MVDEYANFIRAICEEPEDDTRRLAFADWCQENGRPERATFIRNQIQLHGKSVVWDAEYGHLASLGKPSKLRRWSGSEVTGYTIAAPGKSIPCLSPRDFVRFDSEGERFGRPVGAVRINDDVTEIEFGLPELLPPNVIDAWRVQELREESGRLYRMCYQSWFPEKDAAGGALLGGWLQPMRVDDCVTRGFVSWIRTDHDQFMRSVRAGMFRSHPIAQVWFTGLYPDARQNGEFTWWNPKRTHRRYEERFRNEPPQRLYQIMQLQFVKSESMRGISFDSTRGISFDTEAKAVAALSRAAVIHGRRKAGLSLEFARAT